MIVTSQPTGRRRAAWADVYLDPILFILATVSVVVAFKIVTLPLERQHADFFIFWDNVRWYWAGHDLYTAPLRTSWEGPNLNPPALLLLIVPFAVVPVTVAHVTWMILSLILYGVVARWVSCELALPFGRVLSLLLISQATFFAVEVGTFAAPITACVTRAWLAQRRHQHRSVGVWLGIAIACKLFLLPCLGYAVVRRRLGTVAGMVIGGSGTLLLGLLVFGRANTELWIRMLRMVPRVSEPTNGSWMGWLTRAVPDEAVQPWWLLGCAVIGLLLLWQWTRREVDEDAAWIATLSGSLLLSPLGWIYYAPLLIGPFAGVPRSALLWLGYGLLCLPFEWLIAGQSLAWTVTIGSAYFCGFVALFVASLSAGPRPSTARAIPAPSDAIDRALTVSH